LTGKIKKEGALKKIHFYNCAKYHAIARGPVDYICCLSLDLPLPVEALPFA
jgi:hypothetical protein